MQPKEVFDVLTQIGATHLHHANSVATSCTFLEQGALLSRAFVENHRLVQTAQSSDEIDKKYGIWGRIFLDHVDIHDRAGRKKGPNQYGPVLCVFDLDFLLGLPPGSEILATKRNPVHWYDNQAEAERWFTSVEELARSIRFGDFDKMLVIDTPTGKIDLPEHRATIILDDPKKQLSSAQDAYSHAEARLAEAAKLGKVQASVEKRDCQDGCICAQKYSTYTIPQMDFWFG